ncbi:dynactin subunit 3 isoform X3 [Cavia porcellus]|uniref:dynactin subunit 3 isoform X3 n=1 Tax=Cavia porcellus TaxID=10141 RepID=UPI002FE327E1
MAALTDVQRLQARVEELERWVYGPVGARGSRKVADGLVKVQVALGNIASKRERVKILYKKILCFHLGTFLVEDVIKYLDPEYIDRIAIPDASKLQFILRSSLSSPRSHSWSRWILCCPCWTVLPFKDQCVEITDESKTLLEEYNKTTMLLSKQFVQWDELLSQLEAAKQVKPAEE